MKAKLLVIPTIFCASVSAAEPDIKSLENISQELVEIRQEISSLHDQINFEKDKYNDKIRSYASQKADLEVKISRSELNTKELERELEKLVAINKEQVAASDTITPILKDSIKTLRNTVSESLPFKREERLKVLDDIEHRLTTNIITPNKAANQLWAFVEDELVLGRSSGLYNDSLSISGEEQLVKVLRVGQVAMFYRTREDNYGVIKKVESKWIQNPITASDETAQLEYLFDSFNKNIRNGLFTVPNFIPQS